VGLIVDAAAYWERRYREAGAVWGEAPSELARLVVARLAGWRRGPGSGDRLRILDAGCGYGRDSRFLARELGAQVTGVDPAPSAVALARRLTAPGLPVTYVVADLEAWVAAGAAAHDVAVCGAVYHLLGPLGRRRFAAALAAAVRPGGLLFLSALSPRDPQHYARGRPVRGEERSWVDRTYLHFCTADELERDLAGVGFALVEVDERPYEERHADGDVHRHTGWFVEAVRRDGAAAPAAGRPPSRR